MKRCIICGNTGDDNSTVCSVCGGPFEDAVAGRDNMSKTQDMAQITKQLEEIFQNTEQEAADDVEIRLDDIWNDDELAGAKAAVTELVLEDDIAAHAAPEQIEEAQPEAPMAASTEAPEQKRPEAKQAPQGQSKRPRRMKSEPQIYGQAQMGGAEAYQGQQGVMRRTMQGQPSGRAPQSRPSAEQPQERMAARAPQSRPMAEAGQTRPAGRPTPAMDAAQQTRHEKSVMTAARGAIRSPLFFLIAVLNTAALAGSVAAIFLKELNYAQFARLVTDLALPAQIAGYTDQFKSFMATMDNSAVGLNLALKIPALLFCLGLWLVFFCAGRKEGQASACGFGLMKVVVIFRMILSCIVVLAGLVVSVTLVVAAWASGTQNMIISAIVTMAVTIVIAMMVIMYFCCYLATIKTCALSAKTGETYGTASVYVAIVQIILALTSIITLLSGIVNLEISNIVGAIGRMGWLILFGLWILGYRKKIKNVTE